MKRCFVISPIGGEGSGIREHADDVFDYIIKPAMAECGIEPVRSDHLQEPGKITEQMFREILTDDLAIAVLTGHNPNVYYELAVAHAASRPVIVLLEKGGVLPFDVRDIRCVAYDLKPRALFERVYVNQVVAHVQALEANGWKASSPFGKEFALRDRQDPVDSHQFFKNGNEFGTPESWLRLLRETERAFDIMGIHLGPWRSKEFSDLLLKKSADGCAIRILTMHPANPALPEMINESLTDVDFETVSREIAEMAKYFARIAATDPAISLRQVQRGTLHCQTTRTDSVAVFLPYLYSRRRRYCPLWRCGSGSPLYQVVAEEFDGLWRVNEADPCS